MGILELLTILFIVLKLTSVVGWSWWLVFAPLIADGVIYVFSFGMIAGIIKMVRKGLK